MTDQQIWNRLVNLQAGFMFFVVPPRAGDTWHFADPPEDWQPGWWLCVGRGAGRIFIGPVDRESPTALVELAAVAIPLIEVNPESFGPMTGEERAEILARFPIEKISSAPLLKAKPVVKRVGWRGLF